jgi:hypothetical protein
MPNIMQDPMVQSPLCLKIKYNKITNVMQDLKVQIFLLKSKKVKKLGTQEEIVQSNLPYKPLEKLISIVALKIAIPKK